jgi:hypothetical protein
VLKHCAADRKRWLSVLPDVGPYIYDVSRLRVNEVLPSLIATYMKAKKERRCID